ncbi:phosducin, putative [Babesia ovata]|uniref:Phosducin, putative n=1 Tax=Babesia ovata TaxID=189622 RepID=A0A2H6KF58_9APIC|nr:phosducin, putative [Babesia ovata]GBE61625.1 phosducin, putative [Babesia ovata]
MSTTHPTNITTEWDDLQRKHGNLPKIDVPETNEVRDARLVEIAEHELMREARLEAWKKKVQSRKQVTFGVPVNITGDNFIREVTNASKATEPASKDSSGGGDGFQDDCGPNAEASQPDLLSTAGQYIPVLLVDDRQESVYLRDAWNELARRHPTVKFTIGNADRVLRAEGKAAKAPSSILLYFGGKCIMQKPAVSVFHGITYDFAGDKVECRIASTVEALLNSVAGHGAFLRQRTNRSTSDSDSSSDNEDDRAFRSAGKAFQRDFLSQITGGKSRLTRESDSESDHDVGKTYTSWVFDRAFR